MTSNSAIELLIWLDKLINGTVDESIRVVCTDGKFCWVCRLVAYVTCEVDLAGIIANWETLFNLFP